MTPRDCNSYTSLQVEVQDFLAVEASAGDVRVVFAAAK
jgi:hypothetical protein